MKKNMFLIGALLSTILFTGCVATKTEVTKVGVTRFGLIESEVTKIQTCPKLYENHPKSILVLPAKNNTTSIYAVNHLRYAISHPLTEKGYYVFPIHVVDALLRSEKLADVETIRAIPVRKLKELFNADAVLYIDINEWHYSEGFLGVRFDVGLSFSLVDIDTGNEIWQNNSYAYSYSGVEKVSPSSLYLHIITAIFADNTIDYKTLAYGANVAGVKLLPYGEYHDKYKKDSEDKFTFFDVAKLATNRLYVDEYFIYGNKKRGKVPLAISNRIEGQHSFFVHNLSFFKHNGYSNYYLTHESNGKKYLRNRFFKYENHKPYLLIENKKVFVEVEADGKIPFNVSDGLYYFYIDEVLDLNTINSS